MMDTSNLNRGDVVSMMPLPVDERGDYRPPMPAEACSDLGADDKDPPMMPDDTVWVLVLFALSVWLLWAVGSVAYQKVFG